MKAIPYREWKNIVRRSSLPSCKEFVEAPQAESQSVSQYKPIVKHEHQQQAVKVGSWSIHCTSLYSMYAEYTECAENKRKIPQLGVYLDTSWSRKFTILRTPNTWFWDRTGDDHQYPAVIIDWPDRDIIPVNLLARLANFCIDSIRRGKFVEIGCLGGHGRTGTLLAAIIAIAEHIPADQAIAAARTRYCSQAVESIKQEMLIHALLLKGLKEKEK